MAKAKKEAINLQVIEETEQIITVIVEGVQLNVLQEDLFTIRRQIRKKIEQCKMEGKKKYDFLALRDESIRGKMGRIDENLFLAMQSLVSRIFAKRANKAAQASKKAEKKREQMEAVAQKAQIPLLPARQETFLFDTPMINKPAREEHLDAFGKKKRSRKKKGS